MTLLGTDIDGCVLDIWEVLNNIFKRDHELELSYDSISKYKIEECTGLSRDQVKAAVDEAIQSTDIPIYKDAGYYLREYMRDEVVPFITSRSKRHNNETFLNLAKYFPINKLQLFCKGQFSKGRLVRGLGLKYFVDDRVSNVIEVVRENPECRVFLIDRPWNRYFDEKFFIYKGMITRVWGWRKIIETVREESGKGLRRTCAV